MVFIRLRWRYLNGSSQVEVNKDKKVVSIYNIYKSSRQKLCFVIQNKLLILFEEVVLFIY